MLCQVLSNKFYISKFMKEYTESLKKMVRGVLRKDNPNVYFTHIQKTGGTSIDHAISQYYRRCDYSRIFAAPSYRAADVLAQKSTTQTRRQHVWEIREYLVAYEMAKSTKYIAGHVPFSQTIWEEFHNDYIYLIVLRDPVKRFISKYFYNTFKASNHLKMERDLQDVVSSSSGKDWGSEYVRFISGLNNNDDCTSNNAIQKAKDNLEKFNVIGFLENLEAFVNDFHEVSGIRLQISHKRENPVSKPEIDESTIFKIKELCQPDIEIYEYAKNKFS